MTSRSQLLKHPYPKGSVQGSSPFVKSTLSTRPTEKTPIADMLRTPKAQSYLHRDRDSQAHKNVEMLDHYNSRILEAALEENLFSEKTKETKALSHRHSSFDYGHPKRPNYDQIMTNASIPRNSSRFNSKLQLYKDVDSDHQQKMLSSKIYIPDNESDRYSTLVGRRNFDSLPGIKQQSYGFSSMNIQDQQTESQVFDTGRLPDIDLGRRYSNVQVGFEGKFHARVRNVSEDLQRNVEFERLKKRAPKPKNKPVLPKKEKEEVGLRIRVLDTDRKQAKQSLSRLQALSRLGGSPTAVDHKGMSTVLIGKSSTPSRLKDSADPNETLEGLRPELDEDPSRQFLDLPETNMFNARSHSVIVRHTQPKQVPSKRAAASKPMNLMELTLANSGSRVLRLLSKPVVSAFDPSKKRSQSMLRTKPDYYQSLQYTPHVDPRKIVLERDIVDKTKIAEERAQDKTQFVKGTGGGELDDFGVAEQIQAVRRQLVLSEMGVKIPKNWRGEVDVAQLNEIKLTNEADRALGLEDKRNLSPLKSLDPKDAVIASIEPLFPLQGIASKADELGAKGEAQFRDGLQDLIDQQDPLTGFAQSQKTEDAMSLQQGIFRNRLERINVFVDEAFAETSDALLNDANLLQSLKSQIRLESEVVGRPSFSMKPSIFETHWKFMKGIRTHAGTEITKSGILMGEAYQKRQAVVQTIEKKLAARQELLRKESQPPLSEGRSPAGRLKHQGPSTRTLQGALGVVPEDEAAPLGEDFFSPARTFDKRQKGGTPHDTESVVSSQAAGKLSNTLARQETTALDTLGETAHRSKGDRFTSVAHLVCQDPEILEALRQIEKDLFKDKTDASLAQHGITLSSYFSGFLDKYYAAAHMKSLTGMKLGLKAQSKVLAEVLRQLELHFAKKRKAQEMIQEEKDYWAEQDAMMSERLKEQVRKFVQQKKHDDAVLKYVSDKEANESDEDFNIFDQMAAGLSEKETQKKIRADYLAKVDEVKQQLAQEEQSQVKLDRFISLHNLHEVLAKTMQPPEDAAAKVHQKIARQRTKVSAKERAAKEFTQRLSQNYYDDECSANQPEPKNALAIMIQKEIASFSRNMELQSKDHHAALARYLELCQLKQIMPLPLLNKMQKHALVLEDYTVNSGQVEALAEVMELFGPKSIHRVYLNNNNIKDADMAVLLEGVRRNPNIRSLELAFNQVNERAMSALCSLLQPGAKQIRELRLSGVKSSLEQTVQLCETLTQYSALRELRLNNFKLDTECIEHLTYALHQNASLKVLDLGWNQVNTRDLVLLTEQLKGNKMLQQLSLKNLTCTKQHSREVAENLHALIRGNRSLQHLDISYMYFGADDIFCIMEACTKSRSLLSIHLTGNQVEDSAVRAKIRRLMRPKRRIKNLDEAMQHPDSPDEDQKADGDVRDSLSLERNPGLQKEKDRAVRLPQEQTFMPKELKEDKLVYTRVLGHFEMPSSHRWQETDRCWFCEKHQYTLVLVSKSICQQFCLRPRGEDRKDLMSKIDRAQSKAMNTFKLYEEDNLELHAGSDNDEPNFDAPPDSKQQGLHFKNNMIVGKFTGWKPRSLIPVAKFYSLLVKNKESHLREVNLGRDNYEEQLREIKEGKQARLEAHNLRRREKTKQNFGQMKFSDQLKSQWLDKFQPKDFELQERSDWFERILDLLPYGMQNTNFVVEPNHIRQLDVVSQDLHDSEEKMYAFACFLPAGKFNSAVLHNTPEDKHQRIKNFFGLQIKTFKREHEIDLRFKQIRKYRVQRKFKKESSVFKDWVEPDYDKLIDTDLESTKLVKFLKDPGSFERVRAVLQENGRFVVELFQFLQSQGHSAYPGIGWLDFSEFVKKVDLMDEVTKTLGIKDVDIMYIATTSGGDKKLVAPAKIANQLCRSEFFEVLVRIAKHKFQDKGVAKDAGQALSMLLEKHLLTGDKLNMQGGQDFRSYQIWQLPIDDIFQQNLDSVQLVYKHFLSGINPLTAKENTELDIIQVAAMAEPLGISEAQINECFSWSRMPLTDELVNFIEYKKLKLVEWYDFLVRLADMKYIEQNGLTIAEKLENLLDTLFELVGRKRFKSKIEIDVSSESDYASED